MRAPADSSPVTRPLPGLLAALAALSLVACGGGEQEAAPEPREVGTGNGLTEYEVEAGGFSIAVPAGWETLSADVLLEAGELDVVAEENPKFEPYFRMLAGPDSPLKFVALDPVVRKGFATNLLVGVEDLPDGMTLGDYERATRLQIAALGTLQGKIEVGEAALPAGEARTMSYRTRLTVGGTATVFATRQYYLVDGGTGYVITFTTLPALVDAYADSFVRSAGTFRLLSR
jgi:hypothetical protein